MKSLGLRTRIVLMAAVFMLATNLALGISLMSQSRNAMKTLIDERMLDVANTAAAMLDGNVLEHLSAEDKDTAEYQSVLNTLIAFRDNIKLKYIYYVLPVEDGTFTFGIDSDPVAPGAFGSPIEYTDALNNASHGTPSVDNIPYEDAWGRFYSAYSPVFNSDGKVTGVVTVDFEAKWYERQLNQNARTIVLGCALFLIVGIGIVLFLTRQYGNLIERINTNLNDLADDIHSLTGTSPDKRTTTELRGDSMLKVGEVISGLRDDLREHVTHINTQANNMITAMASDYRCVYYINLDENDGVCYRGDPDDTDQTPEGIHFPFDLRFTWYAEHVVADSYREDFLRFIDPDSIREALSAQPIIAYRYLAKRNGREYYEMIRMAGVRRPEERDDHLIHAIGLGFTEIDREMRETMAKNEALAEALEIVEEASLAKTSFLSNMSHEIRTPMNAIIGLDNLALKDETLSEQTREYLEKIGGSARHLLGLINDILDMSRIESGHVILNIVEFSFSEMLEQINTMVMSQCQDKGLTYECRLLSAVDDYYFGDDTKLKEVLINILSNAIKFTNAPGNITMTVERTAVFEEQSTLKFCIRDTGIGIDKDYLPKIFDAFSQEDSSRKNKYGSTGLGMAITKSIVEMMNGTISVESEKGVGTEFTVVLTLKHSDQNDPALRNDTILSGEKEEKEPVNLKGCRVLLAEDIELNAEIMMDILDIEEIEADHAENGRIAVELFRDNPPGTYSAILMDIRMPETDGLEAAETIRAMDRPDAKQIPIIALTANAFDEDVQRSLQVGMNAHLSKPVEPEHLYQTLFDLTRETK